MKSFEYVITDPVGIHARPAGLLVKEIKSYAGSVVTIEKGEGYFWITVPGLQLDPELDPSFPPEADC